MATEEERARAAAAAATAGAGVAGATAIPPATARAQAVAAVVGALVTFMRGRWARSREFLRGVLGPRGGTLDDVAAVIELERELEVEFARKTEERVRRELALIFAIPDHSKRQAAVRGLMAREEGYLRQRDEAMAARAIAALDRVVLRRESPLGAYWELDPLVQEHTAGCLIMGGRFWPWEVLDRVHPPRHRGCPCKLRSYGDAIEMGVLTPESVMSKSQALRMAAGVVMEAEEAEELAQREEVLELAEEALRRGWVSAEQIDEVLPSSAR